MVRAGKAGLVAGNCQFDLKNESLGMIFIAGDSGPRVRKPKAKVGVLTALTLIFIVLKLLGVIDWGWIWVLAPLWLPAASVFVVLVVTYLFFAHMLKAPQNAAQPEPFFKPRKDYARSEFFFKNTSFKGGTSSGPTNGFGENSFGSNTQPYRPSSRGSKRGNDIIIDQPPRHSDDPKPEN